MNAFLDALADLEATSLRRRPPEARQIKLGEAIAASFEQLSEGEREEVRAAVAGAPLGLKAVNLSGLLAETAINSRRAELLRTALVLHAIEGFQSDPRENIRYLVLIAFAAERLGAALAPMIASLTAVATPAAMGHFNAFASRSSDLNRLASFGIQADDAPGGFRFVPA